eukprot:12422675-Karenia_brevis.AAC.1
MTEGFHYSTKVLTRVQPGQMFEALGESAYIGDAEMKRVKARSLDTNGAEGYITLVGMDRHGQPKCIFDMELGDEWVFPLSQDPSGLNAEYSTLPDEEPSQEEKPPLVDVK